MTLQQISQQVRDLILAGELDDAANALVQFFDKEWMSRGDKEQIQLYNQALYQLSQLNELKHQVFAGIISNEDADLKRNKIRTVLLEVSEELKNVETRQRQTAIWFEPPKDTQPKSSSKSRLPYAITGLLAVVLLIWLVVKDGCNGTEPKAGCYIKTGMLTELVVEPKLFASRIGTLPKFKEYTVLAVESYHHADDILFFKINDKKLGVGWVQEGMQLEYTSPECLRQKNNNTTTTTAPNPGSLPNFGDREQPQNTTNPTSPQETEMTGCFVKTRMMTGLLMHPEVMGQPFMELPNNTQFKVLEVKKKIWAGHPTYFFKIKHDRYEGWVRQVELEFVSPECLD